MNEYKYGEEVYYERRIYTIMDREPILNNKGVYYVLRIGNSLRYANSTAITRVKLPPTLIKKASNLLNLPV